MSIYIRWLTHRENWLKMIELIFMVLHGSPPALVAGYRQSEPSIKAGVDWLLRAHLSTGRLGFAGSYSLWRGWNRSYPETTGYLIPTLLNFVSVNQYRQTELLSACSEAGEWLLSVQISDGSFPEFLDPRGAVFDTGEVIFGLIALYRHTQDGRFLSSAERAGDWLVGNQWSNGAWGRFSKGVPDSEFPHAYTSRPAWSLLLLADISARGDIYRAAAISNLDWVVEQWLPNAWIQHSNFVNNPNESLLHTIAYVMEGLLRSGMLLNRPDYIDRVRQTADVLVELHQNGHLCSYYSTDWQSTDRSLCLTGLSQVAVSLKWLSRAIQDPIYYSTAQKIDRQVMRCQVNLPLLRNLHGGIGGSYPIWGRFVRWNLINWAVKFHLDSLILSQSIDGQTPLPKHQG